MLLEMRLIKYIEPVLSLADKPEDLMEFMYTDIVFLPEYAYDVDDGKIFRGVDLSCEKKPFITKTHYRFKDDKVGGFYTPAFRPVFGEEEKELPVDIEIGVDYESLIKLRKLSNGWFVDYPSGKYKYNKKTSYWEFEYDSDAKKSSLGAIHPGFTKIIVKYNGKIYDHERELMILPSSVTFEEMVSMIHEIYYIRQSLVSLDATNDAAKTAIPENRIDIKGAENWYNVLNNIKSEVKKLFLLIEKIDNNPRKGLVKHSCKITANKIKKVNPRIIGQYLANPCRKYYNVDSSIETINIYEHKLIKHKLKELKKYIESRNRDYTSNNHLKMERLLWQMKRLLTLGNITKEEDVLKEVERKISVYEDKFSKDREEIGSKLCMRNFDVENHLEEGIETEWIKLVFSRLDIRIVNNDGGLFQLIIRGVRDKHNNTSELNYFKVYRNCHVEYGKLFGKPDYSIKIECNNYNDMLSLYYACNDASKNNIENDKIGLSLKAHIIIDNNNINLVKIYSIDELLVNKVNKRLSFTEKDAFEELKKIYIDNKFYIDSNEPYIMDFHTLNHLYNQYISLRGNYFSEIFTSAVDELNKILNNTFLSGVDSKPTKWKMTQIFTNDNRYHKVYKTLENLDKLYDFSFNLNEDMIIHDKLENIYEYWIIAKILEKMIIDLKWESVNGYNSVYDIFNSFFDDRDKDKYGSKIVLQHRNNKGNSFFKLELFYDTPLKKSVLDLFSHKHLDLSGKNTPMLKPDYLFRISDAKNNTKVFALDAKYKNFSEMRNEWLGECLRNVCAYKYIEAPCKDVGLQISAAFTVHPDRTVSKNNPNKYLGQYVTFNAACDERCMPILDDWEKEFGDNHHIGLYPQVGSFYLTPNYKDDGEENYSDLHLTMFFQMIFEYYFSDWKECWSCGSNDVTIKELYTVSGYLKFHMHCNKCGSFWVKNHCGECGNPIIKHYVNYQIEDKKNTWHLRCPRCGMNKNPIVSDFESLEHLCPVWC